MHPPHRRLAVRARSALLPALFLVVPCMVSCRAISSTLRDADLHTSPALDRARSLQSRLGPRFVLHDTDHYIIVTDVDSGAARTAARTLQDLHRDFYEHTSGIGLSARPLRDRLICILFEARADYEEYLRRVENDGTQWSSGHYSHHANIVVLHHDRDNPALLRMQQAAQTQPADLSPALAAVAELATLHKTRHEAAHQLLYNSGILVRGRRYPLWIDEGLATQFEMTPSTPNPYRLAVYRRMQMEGSLLPLRQLVEADLATIEPAALGRYYTQAWALMHFLWNRRPQRLSGALEALTAPHRAARLVDEPQFEAEFRRFMDSL